MDAVSYAIALILVLSLSSLALVGNWWQRRRVLGLKEIAAGSVLLTVGVFLLSFRSTELPLFFTVVAGNLLVIGGRLTQLSGLAAFWQQSSLTWAFFSGVCLSLLGVTYLIFTYVYPSDITRTALHSLTTLIICVASVDIIGRGLSARKFTRPLSTLVGNIGSYSLVGIFALTAFIEIGFAYYRFGVGDMPQELLVSLLLLDAIMLSLVTTIGIILMTLEEQKIERLERQNRDPFGGELTLATFTEVGEHILNSARIASMPASLILVEIGNLEPLTRQHGHSLSNQLIARIVQTMRQHSPREVALSRISFNRIAMFCPATSADAADRFCHALADELIRPFAESSVLPTPVLVFAHTTSTRGGLGPETLAEFLHNAEVQLLRQKLIS